MGKVAEVGQREAAELLLQLVLGGLHLAEVQAEVPVLGHSRRD
jgi:hypothetical protein